MDLTEARERMVVEQLERRGIKDARVLAAMRAVARDRLIPPEFADHAYDDGPLPIGSSQTISQPYMVALMSEVAALTRARSRHGLGRRSSHSRRRSRAISIAAITKLATRPTMLVCQSRSTIGC